MPPWPSSRLFIRSVHSGLNFRRPCQHAFILEAGPTTVRPTNENKDTGPLRFLLRLGLPCGTRSRWTCAIPDSHSTTKLKSHFFHSWLIFFRFFIYVLYYCLWFFSSPCAPTWCSLAGAYKCLNWIELNIWDPGTKFSKTLDKLKYNLDVFLYRKLYLSFT